jgi:hypothetical protein
MKERSRWLVGAALAVLGVGVTQGVVKVLADAADNVVHVAERAAPGGDGSAARPFKNLPEAVAAARTNRSGAARINVAPGRYELSQTLLIDFPVDLRGSNQMGDGPDGWPTGQVAPGTETLIVGSAALGGGDLVQVGRDAGPIITGAVTIRNLSFDIGAGTGATASDLHLVKVRNFTLRGNLFKESNANIGILTVASSGRIVDNFVTGVGCGMCIDAGTPSAPANVQIVGNRSVRNRFGGVLLDGTGWIIPETNADKLVAEIRGNDLSDNTASPRFSFGLRVFMVRRDNGMPGDTQFKGRVDATVTGNRMVGNEIGVMIDAGFPFREYAPSPGSPLRCDARVYTGSSNLTFRNNQIQSRLTDGVVSLTRSTASLAPDTISSWQYLHNARFTINDPDRSLAGYWLDHPAADQYTGGICAADRAAESLGNRLVYNGSVVPNGRRMG